MRILTLPLMVANQIAAGEVIERPASVVKELLENAIDAKATAIDLEIHHGGLNKIKVSDNGIGIIDEDLRLAISPHATSKIKILHDLDSLNTLGFRGEALASISAISRFTLISKPSEQTHAMKLFTDCERIEITPCARTNGTTVEAEDIFFNAPVRKKFLKTDRYEFQMIESIVKRFALSVSHVAISLRHNGKYVLELPSSKSDQDILIRIKKILGKSFVENSHFIDIESNNMRLRGWFTHKGYQRSQNDKQWLYINQRMVKDKLLIHAIKKAYDGYLHPGRYPACLLYLTIPTDELDVNVHPTKHEVRFQQPRLVHDFIFSTVHKLIRENEFSNSNFSKRYLDIKKLDCPPTKHEQNLNVTTQWIKLNDQFIIVFIKNEPFLIDSFILQKHYLASVLNQERMPLPSRPLLIPLSHPLFPMNMNQFENLKKMLAEIGIEIQLANEEKLLIRSIPLATPQLNIKDFLDAIVKENLPTTQQLMTLLIQHQSFNFDNLSDYEQLAIIRFLEEHDPNLFSKKTWSKHLSTNFCRDILNA